jgi:hypothetical protein
VHTIGYIKVFVFEFFEALKFEHFGGLNYQLQGARVPKRNHGLFHYLVSE